MNRSIFYAHGKLLLTAEYFVLDGATALAVPVKFGQRLIVDNNANKKIISWQSIDEKGNTWFEADFQPDHFKLINTTDKTLATRLQSIFSAVKKNNPDFLTDTCSLKTELTFPRNWGLGTSSTLIYLIAKWADVNPFDLQFRIFGGSGYDIACAGADGPVLYQLKNGKPHFISSEFNLPFSGQLYFVYLGKKQDSRKGIALYQQNKGSSKQKSQLINEISSLTDSFIKAKSFLEFEEHIRDHESIISDYVGLERAKNIFFKDYWGEIKSLGAWGGDFVLATSNLPETETKKYFNEKGYTVFLKYAEMVLM